MDKKKFYITTPIYYINDVPHIGHTCTTVAADIVARYHRQKAEEVFFLTGTDEHGEKVAEAAAKEGLSPKDFCDRIAPRFEEAWKGLNISFDYFIRTTDPRHEKVVQEFIQRIYDRGDIYKDRYEGWYCTGCERFYTESELVDGKCPLHPNLPVERKSEENWFFKLSKYQTKLIELLEDPNTNYAFPESKRSEILAKLKSGIKDLSISREKVKWGIPVPWDPEHTIYVWFDALINYYSATQFLSGKEDFWPADFHLIAKDILWFHTVIWQAMLLSAGAALPKAVYTHSFYMIDGQKMSKSLGNVISPQQLVDLFGVDGTRFLIARSFPFDGDSDVGIGKFKERYNADLANNLGNLVSRVAKLSEGVVHSAPEIKENEEIREYIENFRFDEALNTVFKKYIDQTNDLLNKSEPWKLPKESQERQGVLGKCINNLLAAANYLTAFMPETAEKIEKVFVGAIKPLDKPLFPRIA
ncbi:class I tRNA ligase family protein [Patescibacteria group bacterium]|nr:class I tRNA ligase family protein [Patescibacteria group bacterium]